MNIPALIIGALLLASLLAPISVLTYLVFILSAFGSVALLPPEIVSSNVSPVSVAVLFFVMKAIGSRSVLSGASRMATNFGQLGFLFLFLIVAVLGAFILPRVFQGTAHVYAMRTSNYEFVAPSTANITQASYLIISTLLTVVMATWMQNEKFSKMLPRAILAGAYAVIATGLLDITAYLLGAQDILSHFRTASYAFLADNFVAGTRRIIGLMPEASAYGGLAASFCGILLFLRPVFPLRLWRWQVPAAAWGCATMAMLSTSSTAYIMVAIILCLYALYDIHKITPDGHIVKRAVSAKILAFLTAGVIGLLVLIFDKDIAERFMDLINAVLFEKQKSTSYIERTGLTLAALDTFIESSGMGVGVGSLRASNFFVNILASTGTLGALLFLAFLWIAFTRRAPEGDAHAKVAIRAGKLALLPIFAGAFVSGTTPDFGPIVATLFGVIIGSSQPLKKTQWISPHLRRREEGPRKRKLRRPYL